MIMYKPRNTDYIETITNKAKNTLCFENSSLKETYNSDVDSSRTQRGLTEINPIILNYLDHLKSTAELKTFTLNERIKYRFKPKLLSHEFYGYTDLWYIILAVNGFNSTYEFENFTMLMMPQYDIIEDIIDKELYNNKDINLIIA